MRQHQQATDTDVIIAGGGPTGLMLAIELTLAGVSVSVLERLEEPTGQSKSLALQPRSAEILELRRLLQEADRRGHGRITDGHFAALPVPLDYHTLRTCHPYQVGIPQSKVEQILEERLNVLGVSVQRGYEVVDFVQEDDGVTVTASHSAGEKWLRGTWLVGCDGGRSIVRKRAGIGFPGSDGYGWAVVADVELSNTPSTVPSQWRSMQEVLAPPGGPTGMVALVPLGEPGLYRLFYGDLASRPDGMDFKAPVPPEEVIVAIADYYGSGVEVRRIRWASRFTDAARQADSYRAGRVLLAGDAAHIHWPAGGQGLNLGLQDAVNLGWKLAADVHGHAPEGLLDTYHSERHPVGAQVLENTRAQSALAQPGPEVLAMRQMLSRLMHIPEVNAYLTGMVSGLDIRYEMDGQPHELLGYRFPDSDVLSEARSEEADCLIHPSRGVLLSARTDFDQVGKSWSGRIDTLHVPDLPWAGTGAVLIRPDGYVCWAATTDETIDESLDRLETSLHRWFGRP
nr:FAD-dependent monooxygenase [Streptomyces canus]